MKTETEIIHNWSLWLIRRLLSVRFDKDNPRFFWVKQALKGCYDDLIKLEKENEEINN